jgi:RNA polymerase sigma factor (sigma-70 family)
MGQASSLLDHLRRVVLPREGGDLTDGQLLERFLSRHDDSAFEAMVRRHGPMIFGVCRRMLRHVEDAEDAFQATFLVLVRKAASLQSRATVGNWLYGVAYHTALKARAVLMKRRAEETALRERMKPALPEESWRETQEALDWELNRLPEKYREAIVLCDLEGKPRKEVARQLHVPESTLSGRLTTARRRLARGLRNRGLTVPEAAVGTALVRSPLQAAVPPVLVKATVQAAGSLALGGGITGVSARVAALTEGVLKTMLLSKLKLTAVALLLSSVALAWLGTQSPPSSATAASNPGQSGKAAPPTAAQAREAKTISTDASVDAVAFSADGKWLATQVRVYEETGEPQARITAHILQLRDPTSGEVKHKVLEARRVVGAEFSPAGDSLAAIVSEFLGGGQIDNHVKLWDPNTGQEKASLAGATASWLYTIAFSRDGKLLAAVGTVIDNRGRTTGGEIDVWEIASGKLLWQNKDHTDQVNGVAFSHDDKMLASASNDQTIKLWDSATGKLLRTLKGHGEHGVYSVAFAPKGNTLASGGLDGTVRLWDAATGELRHTMPGYDSGRIISIVFLHGGKTLAVSGPSVKQDGNVKLYSSETGALVRAFSEHNHMVRSISLATDGRTLAVGCWDKKLVLLPVEK